MNLESGQYSLRELQDLHKEADIQLKAQLLSGRSWKDLQEQMAYVKQLSIAIDQQQNLTKPDNSFVYPYDQQG